jgi:hypothetical protein
MTYNKDDKLILTDVDGVLLWWEDAFHGWMQSRGHSKLPSDTYSLHEHYHGLSKEQAKRDVIEFNGSSWMLGVPAFRDARTGVARLVEAGYKFHAITAMGTDLYAAELRQMNLDRVFGHGVFVDLTVVGLNSDKRAALEPYRGSGLPWVEDSPSHAADGVEMGLDVYLMTHLYNRDDVAGTKRVNCWADICNFILDSD